MAKHQVSTTDETRRQIRKSGQPNGPPDVALQHCKVSCRRMHSCRSKTLEHAALLKHLTLHAVTAKIIKVTLYVRVEKPGLFEKAQPGRFLHFRFFVLFREGPT